MANRKWIIPLLILVLLITANFFRYEEGPTHQEGIKFVKYEYDRWTGQRWVEMSNGWNYMRGLIYDPNGLGNDGPIYARGIWLALIIANLVWIKCIISPSNKTSRKVIYLCIAVIAWLFLGALTEILWG